MSVQQAEKIIPLSKNKTIRLTMAQALVKYLCAQYTEIDGEELPVFAGIWAIFGHGNVAGIGEALYDVQDHLPTYRGHNEQSMAHAAIFYAKAQNRQRMMACTSSIGPGATNMVTAAALAHANRLPVLFLPGDCYASRMPDPVLQQIEDFGDPTITANDCFRPVSRFFDRIMRPEQLLDSLPKAMRVLTDPVDCGPATLALSQDVQAEAFDFPVKFFEKHIWKQRHQAPDDNELATVVEILRQAEKPLIIAGGGVKYAIATDQLKDFAEAFGIPVAETQAGKGSLPWNHPNNVGAIGVTGSTSANIMAEEADVVLAIGTRLQDFTTASRTLFKNPDCKLIQLNVAAFDAHKHSALPLVCDAGKGMESLTAALEKWTAPFCWIEKARKLTKEWNDIVDKVTAPSEKGLPTDAQVMGVVNRFTGEDDIVVSAAGGLPGELHKLWRTTNPTGYMLEYAYSCMGAEIAGGLGVKIANPDRETYVMVGDGSYLMLNSEIATSVSMGYKLTIIVTDNRGFGCINRLQKGCGQAPHNNLLDKTTEGGAQHNVDFAAHAAALGAKSEKAANLSELQDALENARKSNRTYVIVIDTDPQTGTAEGGYSWDVAVAEVSDREDVQKARKAYEALKKEQL